MPIPNDIDFTAFDTLTAAQMDDLIENDNALADGTAIDALSYGVTAVSNPYKFLAYRNAALNTVSPGAVVFDTEVYDTNNNYNTSNGRYTAPITAFYKFDAKISFSVTSTGIGLGIEIWKNGAAYIAGQVWVSTYNSPYVESVVGDFPVIPLAAGDYVDIRTENYLGAGTVITPGSTPIHTWFGGSYHSKT